MTTGRVPLTVTPERWGRLAPYLDAALDLRPEERLAYLKQACADDRQLLAELEQLLANAERNDSLIDRAAAERFSLLLQEVREFPRIVGDRFTVAHEIGRGGMATVYLGHDRKHDRPVAIKVLRQEVAASVGPDRFLREIRTAARLQHPHIMPLHDSGEADGFLYYVMPYARGETLAERLRRERQLPLDDALSITRDVAGALDHAHSDGIIHRDIKPENIFLSGGHALVMDFGIARAVSPDPGDERITFAGFAVGTPAYMSPEQGAAEQTIDGRTDVYALGCVLYEMLAGHPPFMGSNSHEILARHAIDPVPAIRTSRPDVTGIVERAIERALAKAPAARFPTASAFARAFEQPDAQAGKAATRGRVVVTAGIVLIALVLASAWALQLGKQSAAGASESVAPTVAVLAFKNIGRDSSNEALSDGISEEIAGMIARIPGLNVKAPRSSFSLRGKNLSIPDVGQALNVRYLVDGSLQKDANRLRVRVALLEAAKDSILWTAEYDRPIGDVFAIQDEVARGIANELSVQLGPATSLSLSQRPTRSPEAHEFYLRGRFFFEKRDSVSLRKAREYFELAIASDSNYALAYTGLSDTHSHSSAFGYTKANVSMPMATRYVERALELDGKLVEAHASRGFIRTFYDWDWPKAGREFEQSMIRPYASAHVWRGWYYLATDSLDASVRQGRLALAIEPFALLFNTRLVSFLFYARRYDEALTQAQKTLELDSTYFHITVERARVLAMLGRCDQAVNGLGRARSPTGAMTQGIVGFTYAKCGRRAEALAELESLLNDAKQGRSASHYAIATIYGGLGDKEAALTELESAFRERAWAMFLVKREPAFDSLRRDPRFVSLVRRVGLPADL